MPLHVRMLKTFAFFIPINRIQGVQMGGYVHLYTRLGLGKVEPATCAYMVVSERFFHRIAQDWSPLMPLKSEKTRAE